LAGEHVGIGAQLDRLQLLEPTDLAEQLDRRLGALGGSDRQQLAQYRPARVRTRLSPT
jgi:hypothetical protein